MFFRLFATIFVIWLIFKISRWLMAASEQKGNLQKKTPTPKIDDLVEDPHCHTYVPTGNAYKILLNGQNIYFCSELCSKEYLRKKESIYESQEDV